MFVLNRFAWYTRTLTQTHHVTSIRAKMNIGHEEDKVFFNWGIRYSCKKEKFNLKPQSFFLATIMSHMRTCPRTRQEPQNHWNHFLICFKWCGEIKDALVDYTGTSSPSDPHHDTKYGFTLHHTLFLLYFSHHPNSWQIHYRVCSLLNSDIYMMSHSINYFSHFFTLTWITEFTSRLSIQGKKHITRIKSTKHNCAQNESPKTVKQKNMITFFF